MNKSTEVLIYIQRVREFLNTDLNARELLLSNLDEESFFNRLGDVSQLNFERVGSPELTPQQFDFIRVSLILFKGVELEEDSNFIYEYTAQDIKFYLK